MKTKKEYIILVIIIAALSLYLVYHRKDRKNYELPDIPAVSPGSITKVEIIKKGSSFALEKSDNAWHISSSGFPVSMEKVIPMLNLIENFKLTALISESKPAIESENHTIYKLDDDNKITVKAWVEDKLKIDIDVGKAAASYRHTFVKFAGDYRIYQAKNDLRKGFDLSEDNLLDKTVLFFNTNKVREIHFTEGGSTKILALKEIQEETKEPKKTDKDGAGGHVEETEDMETVWMSKENKKVEDPVVNKMLATLSGLKCEGYLKEKKEDYSDPVYKIFLKGDREYYISVFKKTDKESKTYTAVSSRVDYPFELKAELVEKIKKSCEKLFEISK